MKFTKMQGLGNDYVYVNCFKEKIDNPPEVAKIVSNRHFGIGSDGLIMINPSKVADFEMEMYNADGSRGEMCGNGIRCVVKYVYDYGLTDKTHISVETLGGIKYLDLTVKDGKVALVRVDMGEPELDPEKMRVWERGSGETLACGTGACAVAVASILNGYTEREVEIRLLGGNLQIEWNEEDNHVYMTGPATVVFDGEIEL